MADVYSVRVSDEVMERFREFVKKADTNQNDFLSMLLTLYAAKEISDKMPIMENAVKAVRDQTESVTRILIGVGESLMQNQKQALEQLEARRLEMELRTANAEDERDEIKGQNTDLKRQFDNKVLELADSIEREQKLDNALTDKNDIISNSRDKIEALSSVIASQKQDIQDAEIALSENRELKERVKEQALRVSQLEAEKMAVEAERVKTEADKAQALTELEVSLRKEMSEQQREHEQAYNALRQEMNVQQNDREKAFKNYEVSVLEFIAKDKLAQDKINDLQAKIIEMQAEITALKPNAQQEKPAAKARTSKEKSTEGPMEAGTLKHLMDGATPLKMPISTDKE